MHGVHRGMRRGTHGVGAALLMFGLGIGCSTELLSGFADLTYPSLESVTVTPGAVTLAMGASQQLTVVSRDTTDAPMTGLVPVFVSEDTNYVTVDANGVIRGKTEGAARVFARVQSEGMTLEAITIVTVTPTAIPATSFTITSDVSTLAAGQGLTFTATAYSSDGTPIAGIGEASYTSSNPRIARVEFGGVTAVSRGEVQIIGTMNVYGKDFADTVTITVTHPTRALVSILPADDFAISGRFPFQPQVVTIAPGGSVGFRNRTQTATTPRISIDVTFDNPSAVTGGNIPPWTTNATQNRFFPTAGTYTYKSTTTGETGTVIVQ